jgi:hypothetical protein
MALWRIRIRLSDDPHSRAQLDLALAGQRVKDVTFAPRDADSAEMAGDVVLELPQDADLGTLLSALHRISPQVFVSRADNDQAATNGPALTTRFRHRGNFARQAASSRATN